MKSESVIYSNITPDTRIKNGTDLMTSKMTFSNLRPDQRENAVRNTTIAAQTKPRTQNKLSAAPTVETLPEQKKAFLECLCERRLHEGKTWLFSSPDCPVERHGSIKFNPAFAQNHHLTGGQVRKRNAKGAAE